MHISSEEGKKCEAPKIQAPLSSSPRYQSASTTSSIQTKQREKQREEDRGYTREGMALEICFQVSPIVSTASQSTSRASLSSAQHHFSHKEKLNSPVSRGPRRPISPLSPSYSSSSTLLVSEGYRRGNHFICQAKNAVDAVQAATDANWNEVLQSKNTVLIEFWAPWCGPCKMIMPVIQELAKEYAGKLECYQVNTDECPNIANKYGIRSIPTVLFFMNGEKKESIIGAVSKSSLRSAIEKYLE